MILDLRDIKRLGKTESDFFFEYVPENELLSIPFATIVSPVKVSGKVFITENHSAYVEGEICVKVKGQCTRCLSDTQNEYLFEFGENIEKDNAEGYSLINDKINLTEIVDQTIIMNMPVNFLCKEDCKGICYNCGVNLNKEKCKCQK